MQQIIRFYFVLCVVFLTGCAQYEMIPTYHPIADEQGRQCASHCSQQAQSCHDSCQSQYKQCLSEAKIRAEQKLPAALRAYETDLTMYRMDVHMGWMMGHHHGMHLGVGAHHCGRHGGCFFGGYNMPSYWMYDDFYYDRPERPTLASLTAQEAVACSKDCGCDKTHDRCYTHCGGKVTYRKECMKNCSGS